MWLADQRLGYPVGSVFSLASQLFSLAHPERPVGDNQEGWSEGGPMRGVVLPIFWSTRNTSAISTNEQSRFAAVAFDGVLRTSAPSAANLTVS